MTELKKQNRADLSAETLGRVADYMLREAEADGYEDTREWLDNEGVGEALERDVSPDALIALFPDLEREVERHSRWCAEMAHADRYTRLAEQGFYDG